MTAEQSLFLAKKKWDENVYCGMKMENRAVTFPQTRTILDGVNVPGAQLDDIQAILNMRDAWRFLLDTMDVPLTLEYLCKLNEYIARNEALVWGKLRTGQVGISGTDDLPPIPDETESRAARRNSERRHERNRKSTQCVCMGNTEPAFLGRQQAHKSHAGQQDPFAGGRGDADGAGKEHGAI